ncbi:MAG: bifunctional 3-deoxy-7-phosphoheptulonate synthase/chorismate mutase type II [Bacteroidetes bacterium]|nr:bifunctional 3-deoxy-7-phosphoheptulonate synthase/chorismate mutase type II [Bacteroidota bacterium]MCL2302868.1 bifunctional 3-deoxy-7-phosphoheptulonate synthase/chorismate mutase type II [Lentimicrobiaceae bacterium]
MYSTTLNISKIIIAGPCAAESREQLFAAAKELFDLRINYPVAASGDKEDRHSERSEESQEIANQVRNTEGDFWDFRFFRVGVWKARTNPKDFQGVGKDALVWLQEIKKQFGFKICVEVASAEHVQLCIEHNVDAVWIGARSTVNPFLVQEIADAVQDSSLAVFIKNPINPDLNLWVGAIKRFQNSGIKNIMAIHRGFSVENENVYRNAPCWEIPMALRMKQPNIPILCDISHIAGNVLLQQTVAQTAINHGFDGLMIEVHPNPAQALSDSKQQLLPSQFIHLLENITFPTSNNIADNTLLIQRNLIKNIDIQISKLLNKRMAVVDEIAAIKAKHALPLLQPDQWKKVVEIYDENALEDENYRQFLEEFLLLLHRSSLRRQG